MSESVLGGGQENSVISTTMHKETLFTYKSPPPPPPSERVRGQTSNGLYLASTITLWTQLDTQPKGKPISTCLMSHYKYFTDKMKTDKERIFTKNATIKSHDLYIHTKFNFAAPGPNEFYM